MLHQESEKITHRVGEKLPNHISDKELILKKYKELPIWPRNEKLCQHKNLYMNIYSSIINNKQKAGAAQIFIEDEWVNKMLYIYLYKEIIFGNKEMKPWSILQDG